MAELIKRIVLTLLVVTLVTLAFWYTLPVWLEDAVRTKAVEDALEKNGYIYLKFDERWPESDLISIQARLDSEDEPGDSSVTLEYNIKKEKFFTYIPKGYNKDIAYGLLVWVSASDSGAIPRGWKRLMDKHHLIWIGANRSGNSHGVDERRIPMALDAVHNMKKLYNIDPKRIYVSGISGGGKTASRCAVNFPDVFSGGIFIVGVNYWRRVNIPSRQGYYWEPRMNKPHRYYLGRARDEGRFVLLTGDKDINREQTQAYYEKGYKRDLKHVLYIQVPGMGHSNPPAEWFEKAILYLDDKDDGS